VRTIARAPPCNDWVQYNAAGRVVLKLKTPSRRAATHQLLLQMESVHGCDDMLSAEVCPLTRVRTADSRRAI